MMTPSDYWEQYFQGLGHRYIAGVDEVGRGSLAGPVVAAAVIMDQEKMPENLLSKLNDSKKMTAKHRETMAPFIHQYYSVAFGWASVQEIDDLNILQATFLAMSRALKNLVPQPTIALIDGNSSPKGLFCKVKTLIKGDSLSQSIAAASIVAKVTRDAHMKKLAEAYPQYGWERNAGYGTAFHMEGLGQYGPSPHHRRSFAPIAMFFKEKLS